MRACWIPLNEKNPLNLKSPILIKKISINLGLIENNQSQTINQIILKLWKIVIKVKIHFQ